MFQPGISVDGLSDDRTKELTFSRRSALRLIVPGLGAFVVAACGTPTQPAAPATNVAAPAATAAPAKPTSAPAPTATAIPAKLTSAPAPAATAAPAKPAAPAAAQPKTGGI